MTAGHFVRVMTWILSSMDSTFAHASQLPVAAEQTLGHRGWQQGSGVMQRGKGLVQLAADPEGAVEAVWEQGRAWVPLSASVGASPSS